MYLLGMEEYRQLYNCRAPLSPGVLGLFLRKFVSLYLFVVLQGEQCYYLLWSLNKLPGNSKILHEGNGLIYCLFSSAKAMSNPEETGKVKYFCRARGHGFITPHTGSDDVFVHISELV